MAASVWRSHLRRGGHARFRKGITSKPRDTRGSPRDTPRDSTLIRMEPQPFFFTEKTRTTWQRRFWRCPVSLVDVLPEYWVMNCGSRGSGSVTAVLPILCLSTWPTPGSEWTRWAYLSRRRIAAVSGICTDTVGKALTSLESEELLELKQVPYATRRGAYKTQYRLFTEAFYPTDTEGGKAKEPFVKIFSNLLYGGVWKFLPTCAARHLYLTIACLNPIRDLRSFRRAVSQKSEMTLSQERMSEIVRTYREKHPLSLTDLQSHTGLTRPTVIHALKILRTSLGCGNGDAWPFVRRGKLRPGKPTWYAPHRRFAQRMRISYDVLNDVDGFRRFQHDTWGELITRQSESDDAEWSW